MKHATRPRLTRPDAIALAALAENLARAEARGKARDDGLEEVIELAQIMPANDIPAEVATLNSRVAFADQESGATHRVTLVLPDAVDPATGCISVVSPIGRALLGRSVGDIVAVELPHGRTREIRLLDVLFQPEAQARRQSG